ncbi:DUF928 domain-containing protein [Alkalinema sp. FACHB-956]|uniref:DUF928 domain-containing protein n=1 Tax=Alkalinema sp. FACHB-956 TaxID=2692768 RepID=UPI001682BEB5|nr:DUF928 domain-containing protein [Alkalinema sp. FACHB-956]MBD2329168.1 DUF928 domain-containing protein [Alkalinema sp. FACHB-956]
MGEFTKVDAASQPQKTGNQTQLKRPVIRFISGKSRGNPPKSNNPGGSRNSCPNVQPQALVYTPQPDGFTLSDRPTFWLYFPYQLVSNLTPDTKVTNQVLQSDMRVRLIVRELSDNQAIYDSGKKQVKIAAPGFVALRLPAEKTLAVGKKYRWMVELYCGGPKRVPNAIEGIVERVGVPSQTIETQLKQAKTDLDRLQIYAQNGFWYETVDGLIRLREKMPEDLQIQENWQRLLEEAQIKDLKDQKIQELEIQP